MHIGDGYEYEFPAQQGWICPKCGRVNAPWLSFCPCYEEEKITYTTTSDSTVLKTEDFNWVSCIECCYEPMSPNCPSYGTLTGYNGCFKGIKVSKKSK